MKAADAMPESKFGYRPTKDVRPFAEILNQVADISYSLRHWPPFGVHGRAPLLKGEVNRGWAESGIIR